MPVEAIEQDFPNLSPGKWEITSPIDEGYNCIAFAVHDTRQFWDPSVIGVRGYYWPPGVPRNDSLQSWLRVFELHGYRRCENGVLVSGQEKIAVYTDETGSPQHVARQLPEGRWTSKLGGYEDIGHDTAESLESYAYGRVAVFMARPAQPKL